jgi:hypothetical protein
MTTSYLRGAHPPPSAWNHHHPSRRHAPRAPGHACPAAQAARPAATAAAAAAQRPRGWQGGPPVHQLQRVAGPEALRVRLHLRPPATRARLTSVALSGQVDSSPACTRPSSRTWMVGLMAPHVSRPEAALAMPTRPVACITCRRGGRAAGAERPAGSGAGARRGLARAQGAAWETRGTAVQCTPRSQSALLLTEQRWGGRPAVRCALSPGGAGWTRQPCRGPPSPAGLQRRTRRACGRGSARLGMAWRRGGAKGASARAGVWRERGGMSCEQRFGLVCGQGAALPTPAAARYMAAGEPSPPQPMMSTEPLQRRSWRERRRAYCRQPK